LVVTTTYRGAGSQVVADTVTTPLEQQINGVPGMAYMSSVSANDGSPTVIITKKPDIMLGINIWSPEGSVDLVTLSNYVYLQFGDGRSGRKA
jgi:AcrB/AcrD/AcrF family